MAYTGEQKDRKRYGQGTYMFSNGVQYTGERSGDPSSNDAELWCMKKQFGYLFLSVLLMFVLYGCGRDLSTPSRRLVGHWKTSTALEIEYFVSKIDSKTGQGTITMHDLREGTVFIGKYRIRDEQPKGDEVAIIVTWPEGSEEVIDFWVAEDGSGATMYKIYIRYVDGKTEP